MIVLIPAYEPTDQLLKLVSLLQAKTNFKIIIVNDGSSIKYANIFESAKNLGCIILTHNENMGKGTALKTGFSYLYSYYPNENIVCADSDGQHSVNDIIKVADAINVNNNEMILGIRQFKGKIPLKSRIGNNITAFCFKLATGIKLTDTQTGLRGYPYSLIPWLISIEGNRFEYELNLLLFSKNNDTSIKQIPIETIYNNSNKGTHFKPFIDSIRVFYPILKFCGSSLSSALLDFILLFVFQTLTGSLFLGVVLARIISSTYNYTINKFFVFNAKKISHKQTLPKYFSLVIIIMFLNYFLLNFLVNFVGISEVLAKIIAEITLFILSYTVQLLFIFIKKKKK